MTKEELEITKRQIECEKLLRRAKIEEVNDYIQFFATKLSGLGCIIFGVVAVLNPHAFNSNISRPEILLGVGFGLLAGKSLLKLIVNVAKAMEGKS